MKIIFLSYASYWQRFFFFQNVTKSAIFFPTLIISYLSSTCQASHALVSYFASLKHNYKQRCPQSLNLPKEKLFSKWGRPSPPPRSDACMDNRWRVNFEDCSTERKLKKKLHRAQAHSDIQVSPGVILKLFDRAGSTSVSAGSKSSFYLLHSSNSLASESSNAEASKRLNYCRVQSNSVFSSPSSPPSEGSVQRPPTCRMSSPFFILLFRLNSNT